MLRLVSLGIVAAVLSVTAPKWTPGELATLREMSVSELGGPPPDPTNRFADEPAAARLGEALFADPRFSGDGKVSCASCHRADYGFTDDLPLGRGVGTGVRRTMPLASAAYSPWQFWDGRADSLWAQALGPLENPVEHGSTRVQVAARFVGGYSSQYQSLFGGLPDLSDGRRFPAHASPLGEAAARLAWNDMAPNDRHLVNQVFANFGKAIAAFERTIPLPETRFDQYVAAVLAGQERNALLSRDEQNGLKLFIGKAGCVECHSGPLLTNNDFANTGVPEPSGLPADHGRVEGMRAALSDPFNCLGSFSDARARCDELEFLAVESPEALRAYKAPSLRGVAARPPFMHAGQFGSLAEVIDHYDRAPPAARGRSQLQPLKLTRRERADLTAFLTALNPVVPSRPRSAKPVAIPEQVANDRSPR